MHSIGLNANVEATMCSGQPPHFFWSRLQGSTASFARRIDAHTHVIMQWGKEAAVKEKSSAAYARALLRESDDLERMRAFIATDEVMEKALDAFPGLRLTKSDPWETTLAYLCSSNNHIPRIQSMVRSLIDPSTGRAREPHEIPEMNLRSMGFGYRAEYVQQTSACVAAGEFDLQGVTRLSYEDAKKEMQTLPGIGPKVADCILLYGFGFLEAFPQDVWIQRVCERYYGKRRPQDIASFARRRWGEWAGYAQQYLFWWARQVAGAEQSLK